MPKGMDLILEVARFFTETERRMEVRLAAKRAAEQLGE